MNHAKAYLNAELSEVLAHAPEEQRKQAARLVKTLTRYLVREDADLQFVARVLRFLQNWTGNSPVVIEAEQSS